MDTKSVKCLINSISRFIHLVACQTVKMVPIQKDYRNMVDLLKLLKPVLDEVIDSNILVDEMLVKEIEDLDMVINEARDFLEKWNPKMSKILSVLQSELLAIKIQNFSIDICHILCIMLQSSSLTSQLVSVKHCLQELQCSDQERISDLIKSALRDQKDTLTPHDEIVIKISESLGLTSNQELLMESLALEKEKARAQLKELDLIDQIVDLIEHIRNYMAKLEHFGAINGLSIPPYFRCPLSLGLMLDPVIVASGQTYERAFIQKWLDHGVAVCPKTRQSLVHTNLIPNYTVKALIANWCEDNKIRCCDTVNGKNISTMPLARHVHPQDYTRAESFPCSFNSNNSTPRSSLEAGNRSQKVEDSSKYNEDSNTSNTMAIPKCDQLSPEQSYIHSRSESASSAISSIDYLPPAFASGLTEVSGLSSKHGNVSDLFGEVTSNCSISSPSKESGFSPWVSGKKHHSSKAITTVVGTGSSHQRSLSLPFSDSGFDDLTSSSHVEKLVEDLKSKRSDRQTTAAEELRLLAKHNMDNRIIIAHCGAIPPLVSLLYSAEKLTQEHAVTALLNLSINENNKIVIAEAGAIEPLIYVLKSGNTVAKENAAASLFSLSVLEEYKIRIGRSAAVKALVDLLGSGTLRGKKDAATALFNLSIYHENKARIVQAGAVKYLIGLMDPDTGMIDKCVALLANLSTIPEGRLVITREGGIPLLVEVVEMGSQRGKENAASILLQLCFNSQKFCTLVLQEGAVPPLVALSQSGTPRAKEKAQQILSHFRNQREGSAGKAK
ncbi:hypothetical protein AQUCO_03400353v1 [Aquilegia coerulea]|uniref:RING-type E3 ubiquitin transferase n=1 Tax=Aquilegia coerulea TaxID=218851 RepID=A0A2G5CYS1_AQUCA|nr:hypothetical protein AQUCO_03400353v1 [Aquilegia coerulea]PIA36405.1 hypothetical protein AQUCO_03400353v1 [Aquilegia coerulea]PIA36406.1 hypothetical protein AQUCO_03400353v1 [Aquilegia coerulea]PIA36407.1 hypothetical protein AQUCO_03400353v1 [Aquilegia coerulea]PIA36408.1 hypothetical protein AQUCO_03400353v1 [Aquilegia coerulea]